MKKKAKGLTTKLHHRRNPPNVDRSAPILPEKPTILIVCEGKNTEPSYFRQFRLASATVKALGLGFNTVSLVESAIDIANKGKYDQVWCVFDKDDFSFENFNNAIN
jgi:RloB-like protein